MKFIDKVQWRINFLLKEGRRKSLNAIIYNLLPHPPNDFKDKLILKEIKNHPGLRSLIKIQKSTNDKWIFNLGLMTMVYSKSLTLQSFIQGYFEIIYSYVKDKKASEIGSLILRKDVRHPPYEYRGAILEDGDYVIDAGANIGMFSLIASQRVGKSGKIFAFEPIPRCYKLLEENIKINKAKNIKIIPLALGEKKKKTIFFVANNDLGRSSGFFHPGNQQVKVEQTTVDNFVQKNKIKKIDFLKADIEGMERNLLQGAVKTIKEFHPKMAICNYHRPDDPKILAKMIKDLVPSYELVQKDNKIYSWINKNR